MAVVVEDGGVPVAVNPLARVAVLEQVRAVEEDQAVLLSFFDQGRAEGDFETGIERGLQLILSDPEFIYRAESVPVEAIGNDEYYAVSDLELASRLSFFLWSSPPDEELLAIAEAGNLRDDGVLEQQVNRLLDDPHRPSLRR